MRFLSILFVVVVGSLFSGCPQPKVCSASTCSGCCDSQGECQAGDLPSACGASGNQCVACSDAACDVGVCVGNGGIKNFNEFCNASVKTQYDYFVRCGAATRAAADEFIAMSAPSCEMGLEMFTSGRARFEPAGAQPCLDEYRDLACDKMPSSGSCPAAVTGLVPNGGACYSPQECVTGHWCDLGSTCPGTCKPQVAIGQPRDQQASDNDCVIDAYPYGANCEAFVALGMPCGPEGGVLSNRVCVPGAMCSPSTALCVEHRLLDTGAACTPNASPGCRVGTQCVANRMGASFCTPLGDANQLCDIGRGCKQGLQCGPADVCVASGVTGATCNPGQAECSFPLFCDANSRQCTTPRGAGSACTDHNQCDFTLWCSDPQSDNGICVARLGVGAACERQNETATCAHELYCTTLSTNANNGVCAVRKGPGETCNEDEECDSKSECHNGACTRFSCSP